MATLQGLIDRTRLELGNLKEPFYTRFRTSGEGTRYDLKGVTNIEEYVFYEIGDPDTPITSGVTVQERPGIVIFDVPPEAGSEFVVEGETAKYFSNEEMQIFVESAFRKHTHNQVPAVNYSSLPPVEDHLVAILAKIEALWVMLTSAAYDINVHAPEGMFVPRGQRYQQLRELLMATEQQYKELSQALGVGFFRVEMFDLRRVSRWTNRLVPVYLPREFDDTRPPQRVYPAIGAMGEKIPERTTEAIDFQVVQGYAFVEELEIQDDNGDPVDLATMGEIEAVLYRTPYAVHPHQRDGHRDILPEFETEIDAIGGVVRVKLTAEDTKKMQGSGSYVWNLIVRDEDGERALIEGDVLVSETYPIKSTNVQV